MALGINKVILVGNLGRDPEIRTIESGAKVASFSIATTETYKDREGNKQEQTEWHRIVAWRGLADIIERYVRKGSKLYIEGKLTTRSYETDGVTKYITEVSARDMLLLDSRQGGEGSGIPLPPEPMQATQSSAPAQAKTTGDNSFNSEATDEDDLPF